MFWVRNDNVICYIEKSFQVRAVGTRKVFLSSICVVFVCLILAPVLDRILQPMTTVVLGPVWVTKGGERFSPKGAQNFIGTLLMSTRDRLRQSRAYKEQVRHRGRGWGYVVTLLLIL